MNIEVLFNPLFWVVVALYVGIWKAGSLMQHVHEENIREKKAANHSA